MTGLYFEELEVGREFNHEIRRTVTEADNLLFTTMTHNPQPLHLDAEFARQSHYGQILVNSYFTLALAVGISVGETTVGTTIGNLGMERVEFPNPVFIGDTLRVRTRITDRRESNSKPDRGIVWFEHVALNQRDEIVCECTRKGMMLKKPVVE